MPQRGKAVPTNCIHVSRQTPSKIKQPRNRTAPGHLSHLRQIPGIVTDQCESSAHAPVQSGPCLTENQPSSAPSEASDESDPSQSDVSELMTCRPGTKLLRFWRRAEGEISALVPLLPRQSRASLTRIAQYKAFTPSYPTSARHGDRRTTRRPKWKLPIAIHTARSGASQNPLCAPDRRSTVADTMRCRRWWLDDLAPLRQHLVLGSAHLPEPSGICVGRDNQYPA